MNKQIVLLFSLYFFSIIINAQPKLNFTRYTAKHGLQNNDVLSICQDKFGFMWFGTKNGCSRFDGVEFKNYQNNKNEPGSISQGWVNKIVCDKQGRLWLAMAGEQSTFMSFDYADEIFFDVSSIVKDNIGLHSEKIPFWSVYADNDGYIWVQPTNGFLYLNPENHEIENLHNKENIPETLPLIKVFFEDGDNKMWFASADGIYVYDKNTNAFASFGGKPDGKYSISIKNCLCIFQDSEKNIWIGTQRGLNKLVDPFSETSVIEQFLHEKGNPNSLSNNIIHDITEDKNGNLVIATVNGLNILNIRTNKIFRYYNDEMDPNSINSNHIRVVFRDKHNNIWVGTSNGVGKLQHNNFSSFSYSSYKNSISHNKVQSICEAKNGEVWIATPEGIDFYDPVKNTFRFGIGLAQNNKGIYASPVSMYPDHGKGMWIGTWGEGLIRFDYASGKTRNYNIGSNLPLSYVLPLCMDSNSNLWLASIHSGLYKYDLNTGKYRLFEHNSKDTTSLCANSITYILEDSNNNIWVGTRDGLNKLIDIKNGKFEHYLSKIKINHIAQGQGGHIWIASEKGLNKYKPENQVLKNFSTYHRVPEKIFSVLEDNSGNVWISSSDGFFRIQFDGDRPQKVTLFREEEGVSVGDFIPRSCAKLSDGSMIFGGNKGFCRFHPETIKDDTIAPSVVFTGLKVGNQTVKIGQEINKQEILNKSITTTSQLLLNHKNNDFSIKFSGIQYNMPEYSTFAYCLEGYGTSDSAWNFVNAYQREIKYMNLPEGNYTFKVKAANSYGIWNEEPAELKIIISAPWWETTWAILGWCILLIIFILFIIRIRTYSLQIQKKKLTEIVEQRTNELKKTNLALEDRKEELEQQANDLQQANANLEQKNNQIEKMAAQLHDADQKQIRFFANISHEFRTPLSLILGPLEQCLDSEEPIEWNKLRGTYLNLMHRNAKRLLRLINEIIDFRKISQGRKSISISNNNIEKFISEVLEAFSLLAASHQIQLTFDIGHSTLNKNHLPLNSQPQQDKQFKTENTSNKDDQMSNNNCNMINEQYSINNDKWSTTNDKSKLIYDFWFDPDIMEKILYNIISNAIKYTPEGGGISISIGIVETQLIASLRYQLVIKISDTGIGIKPENLDKIFDRFYRADNIRKEGSGIGLAYTKELVELHKGSITVESKYGKGTCFTLQFPFLGTKMEMNEFVVQPGGHEAKQFELNYTKTMLDEVQAIQKSYSPEYEIIEIKNKDKQANLYQNRSTNNQSLPKLLLVEDNQDMQIFITNILKDSYTIYKASDGLEGINNAVQQIPDIIISDVMMPRMDGVEMCKKLKTNENTCHIPIILLTAKTGEENIINGLKTGADDYINKPFSIEVLKLKIENILNTRKLLREKFSQSIHIKPEEISTTSIDEKFLKKAIEIVEANLSNDEFSNTDFISQLGRGRTMVYEKIKALTNQSVSEFIRSIRLKKAAVLLLEGEKSVKEVAVLVGFKHRQTFSNQFTAMFGKPPTEFIEDNRAFN